jgi:hypothetical protein
MKFTINPSTTTFAFGFMQPTKKIIDEMCNEISSKFIRLIVGASVYNSKHMQNS